jgi:hypothetical protein
MLVWDSKVADPSKLADVIWSSQNSVLLSPMC